MAHSRVHRKLILARQVRSEWVDLRIGFQGNAATYKWY